MSQNHFSCDWLGIVLRMRLADRIAQCRTPFIVQSTKDQSCTSLSGAATFAKDLADCPTRYVLNDDLVRLCTALAYSKGAQTLKCADLLYVPAPRLWVEWCEAPWIAELKRYGFKQSLDGESASGRRGAFILASPSGRRGMIRTFWSMGETSLEALASSMEAYFDLDTRDGEEPMAPDAQHRPAITVFDSALTKADVLRQCFRFRYERTWADYYSSAALSPVQRDAVAHHSLGAVAIAIPVLLAFFLLLAARPGLPRRPLMLERLNQARRRSGKATLLDHVEVRSPILPEYSHSEESDSGLRRRTPRLHHVRGHLVRRGSQLFWRVPHLRGNARSGIIRARTVTWTIDADRSRSQRLTGAKESLAEQR